MSVSDRLRGAARLRLGEQVNRETLAVAARTVDPAQFEAGVGVSLTRFMADAMGTRVRRVTAAEWATMRGAIDDLMSVSGSTPDVRRPADLHLLTGCADGIFLVLLPLRGA